MKRHSVAAISYALMIVGVSLITIVGVIRPPSRQAFLFAISGGAVFLIAVFLAVRFGDELQCHPSYVQEIGKAKASTPYAWFANKVRGPRFMYNPPPAKIPSRTRLIVQGFITAYFASTLSVTLVGVPSVVYVGVVVLSVVSSVVATYFLYDSLYDEERAAEEEQLEDAAP